MTMKMLQGGKQNVSGKADCAHSVQCMLLLGDYIHFSSTKDQHFLSHETWHLQTDMLILIHDYHKLNSTMAAIILICAANTAF
jgi:uncharacterized protein (DUF952 family)